MRIAVLAPQAVPPVFGGAERLVSGLRDALVRTGDHDADVVTLPLREQGVLELLESYAAWRQIDVTAYDLVISTKYPTWMVRHPQHVLYLLHVLRGLYDTYHLFRQPFGPPSWTDEEGVELGRLLAAAPHEGAVDEVLDRAIALCRRAAPDSEYLRFPGPLVRSVVHYLDAVGMSRRAVTRYAAISSTVAGRPGYLPPGTDVAVAYPPPGIEPGSGWERSGPGEHLLAVSRLDGPKRFDLLLEAMAFVPSDVRLKLAGTGPEADRLASLAADEPRVELLGFVEDEQLAQLYQGARAVPFLPLDEDFGLITVEASRFGVPVITCGDSGGPAELVVPGRTGLVVAPTPPSLASAITAVWSRPGVAASLGTAARRHLGSITWERVVEVLLGPSADGASRSPGGEGAVPTPPAPPPKARRRQVTVVSTFAVHPRRGGGQLRSFHLYGGIAERFDVEIVSLGGPDDSSGEVELGRGFRECVVPKSDAHVRAERREASEAGFPVDDIVADELLRLTPRFAEVLSASLERASCAVLAHPFLYPIVARLAPALPVVYDAHNAELSLKRSLLEGTDRPDLLDVVARIEGGACRAAAAISVCSTNDADLLREDYGVALERLVLVPNGSDVGSIPFTTGNDRAQRGERWLAAHRRFSARTSSTTSLALFIGSWHPPNNEAGAAILEMAPRLPDVHFVLVGSHCHALREEKRSDNVTLLGVVDPAVRESLLGAADVALNPMQRGSGSNLKIGDYFAAGVPVVSTPVGVRGLDVADREHLRVVGLDAFPEAIRDVLADRARADAMAAQARRLVEDRYDWRVLARSMTDLVETAMASVGYAEPPAPFLVAAAR